MIWAKVRKEKREGGIPRLSFRFSPGFIRGRRGVSAEGTSSCKRRHSFPRRGVIARGSRDKRINAGKEARAQETSERDSNVVAWSTSCSLARDAVNTANAAEKRSRTP